jgi:hypothetical protein
MLSRYTNPGPYSSRILFGNDTDVTFLSIVHLGDRWVYTHSFVDDETGATKSTVKDMTYDEMLAEHKLQYGSPMQYMSQEDFDWLTLTPPVEFPGFGGQAPHANYKTPGCAGIMRGFYYRGTILSADNEYIKYPKEVEICVWIFGSDGTWATFNVRDPEHPVWVQAKGARFENVVPIHKPEINP